MGSSTPASPSGNTYVETIDYAMDDDGNRTSVVTTPYGVSPTTESYTTNTLNQYTAVGGASPTYDGNGNLTDNGTYKFKYNYRNLICEARLSSSNNLVATYMFDAAGRRIGKAVSGGVTERSVYADIETIAIYDGSNGWKQDYAFDVTGIDRVVMLEQADVLDQDGDNDTTELTRYAYHRSALGSLQEVSSANQVGSASYRYAPFGKTTIAVGGVVQTTDPLSQSISFTSRTRDGESGVVQCRFRTLDSDLGRFLQRDPVGYVGGASLLEYVDSNPINSSDPMGLEERHEFKAALKLLPKIGVAGVLVALAAGLLAQEIDAPHFARSPGGGGGEEYDENALRHCFWHCYMMAAGLTAEQADLVGHTFEEMEYPNGMSDQDKFNSAVDSTNNHGGIRCGQGVQKLAPAARLHACQHCCMRQARRGELACKFPTDPPTPDDPEPCSDGYAELRYRYMKLGRNPYGGRPGKCFPEIPSVGDR